MKTEIYTKVIGIEFDVTKQNQNWQAGTGLPPSLRPPSIDRSIFIQSKIEETKKEKKRTQTHNNAIVRSAGRPGQANSLQSFLAHAHQLPP